MLTKFWESVGTKLGDRLAAVTGPALLFALTGVLLWTRARGGFKALIQPRDWLVHQSGATQLVLAGLALAVAIAAGLLVQRFTPAALRLIEGYWPERARRPLVKRAGDRYTELRTEWAGLAPLIAAATATPEQRRRFAVLDTRLRRLPTGAHRLMPTTVGNILRAAETRPRDKYGLDGVSVWPVLWLVLPDSTRDEIRTARAALDAAVAGAIWALLAVVYTVFSPWMLLAAPILAALIHRVWIVDRAATFADLVEASYDLYRQSLYTQLRWPLPANPADEYTQGQRINAYLLRGERAATPTFTTGGSKAP